ncbi:hypothetical protein ACFQV2_16960 [Actinokineospora soli]|uniref:Uncharacterized protein n=1 Tax=Actinokineospora soli TaxID=1048753 RepID=A0ABW2TQA8_9PSEU
MIEDQLRASFAARADDPAETSDLTDRVIGRATVIRRRRTVVGAAVGSVTAAIVGFLALAPTTHTASDVPVATPRPASVAYGAHHVVLSDGTERKLTDATIEDARAVAGGWIVTTDKSVTYVPQTGTPTDLGPVPATVAINRAGTRVSIQTWGDDPRVEVFTLPALDRIGLIVPNPNWVATQWMGDHLVITAPNGDAGPVPAALWDPTGDPRPSAARCSSSAPPTSTSSPTSPRAPRPAWSACAPTSPRPPAPATRASASATPSPPSPPTAPTSSAPTTTPPCPSTSPTPSRATPPESPWASPPPPPTPAWPGCPRQRPCSNRTTPR